jgi:catechol-2,3-dioxygenase
MEIKELGHVVLTVGNLHRSVHFYGDVLGFREVSRLGERGERGVMFSSGRTHHELLLLQAEPDAAPIPSGRPLGLSHFALKVGTTDDELRGALAELEAADVPIEHTTDHGVTHSVYLKDPDGNRVELYIDVQPEVWREDPSAIGRGARALAI